MVDERLLARLVEQTVVGDPERHSEFAVAEQDVAAARRKILAVAEEIVHHDVGGVEVLQLLEEAGDIPFGVVVADAAVQHLCVLACVAQHLLQPGLDRAFFGHAPAKGDRAAEEQDQAPAWRYRFDRPVPKSPLVEPDGHVLENGGLRLHVIEVELRVGATDFEIFRVTPHLDVVRRHRAVLQPKKNLAARQCYDQGDDDQESRKKNPLHVSAL